MVMVHKLATESIVTRIHRYPGGSKVIIPGVTPTMLTPVTNDQFKLLVEPPRSAACNPSALLPCTVNRDGLSVVVVEKDTLTNRKSPTKNGALVEVEVEVIAANLPGY